MKRECKKRTIDDLSKRDRQILDAVLENGPSTAREIHSRLDFEVSYSTVRTFLTRLEERGLIRHRKQGKTYLYVPVRNTASDILEHIKQQLVGLAGSPLRAAAVFLDMEHERVTEEDIAYLKEVLSSLEKRKTDE